MILYATQAVLVIGGLLLRYLAQQISHDQSCNKDSVPFQRMRFGAFCATSLAALGTAFYDVSPLAILIVISVAVCILTIDIIVLHLRPKPPLPPAESQPIRFDAIAARARTRRL